MTGHFTTLDGCERWAQIVGPATEFYKVPISYPTPTPEWGYVPRSTSYAYRLYRLEGLDYSKGLAEYVEVHNEQRTSV